MRTTNAMMNWFKNNDDNTRKLSPQTIQQYDTIQNYVSTLFDSLPRVSLLTQQQHHLSQNSIPLITQLLTQTSCYGKKIIQLSQKFTSIYRKDHVYDKKTVQENIWRIYQLVREEGELMQGGRGDYDVDQMLTEILAELKGRNYQHLVQEFTLREQQREQLTQNVMKTTNQVSMQSRMDHNMMMKSQRKVVMGQSIMNSMGIGSVKESRVNQNPNQNLYLHDLNSNGESIGMSRKKSSNNTNNNNNNNNNNNTNNTNNSKHSKVSSTSKSTKKSIKNILQQSQIPLKKILKIKHLMESQQSSIKHLIQKVAAKIDELKISKLNLSEQRLTYTKVEDETNRENLQSLLQASTSNHKANLGNLSRLMQLVFGQIDKRMGKQALSENRFALYTKQIQKRQQVYSYAVSKLITHVNNLKNSLNQQRYSQSLQIVEDLISIGTKFYDLYPSHEVIKDLKVVPVQNTPANTPTIIQQCNYGVQVNTIKSSDRASSKNNKHSSLTSGVYGDNTSRGSGQYQLEMFKFQTKLSDMLEKFEKNYMKFKKVVQVKQVNKLITMVKELVPDRGIRSNNSSTNPNSQESMLVLFQQQYKHLVNQHEQKQAKMLQQSLKKQKKYQKTIKQLQQAIQLCEQQRQKQVAIGKQQLRRVTKKFQSLQDKYHRLQRTKQQLQVTIKSVSLQIQSVTKNYREQQLLHEHKYQQIENKLSLTMEELAIKEMEFNKLLEGRKEKQNQVMEDIMIYKKKIVLLEQCKEQKDRENQVIGVRMEKVVEEKLVCEEKLAQINDLYNQKIKQVQQLTKAIEEITQSTHQSNDKIHMLQEQITTLTYAQTQQKVENKKLRQTISQLNQTLSKQRQERERTAQVGQLNEDDIQKLKQQIHNVHSAYMQSQQELQGLRTIYEQLQQQYTTMQHNQLQLESTIKQLQSQNRQLLTVKSKSLSIQTQNNELQEQLSMLQQKNEQLLSKQQQLQNEIFALKKQMKQLKNEELTNSTQLRQLRQNNQKLKQQDSINKAKNKIQLETLKIQLRKKTQETNKNKQIYQEKIGLLQNQFQQLQKYISQKELLAKISNNHSTQ